MSARDKFIAAGLEHIGETVLMGQLDCSELVALAFRAAGGPDQTKTHTAQRYHDETRPLVVGESPLPGDLAFYGVPKAYAQADGRHVFHVVVWMAGGHVLSADGATSRVTTLEEAKRRGASVRVHNSVHYRIDLPYVVVHRFTALDALDKATR